MPNSKITLPPGTYTVTDTPLSGKSTSHTLVVTSDTVATFDGTTVSDFNATSPVSWAVGAATYSGGVVNISITGGSYIGEDGSWTAEQTGGQGEDV